MLQKEIEAYLARNKFENIVPKAVFFDMDGVIFDSMPHHAIAWVKAMNDSGLPFSEKEAYMSEGQPGADTINAVFIQYHGRESSQKERNDIYTLKGKYFAELGKPKKMPYITEILNKVQEQGLEIFVVTGSGHPHLLNSLEESFPGIFSEEKIISAFNVERGKPFPEPYLKALKKANAKPWEAIVVENAPLGVQSSSAAQIFTIGVNTGPLDKKILLDNGADIVFDSMKDFFNEWRNIDFFN